MKTEFQFKEIPFDKTGIELLKHEPYSEEYWPIVYLIRNSDDKKVNELYVGETTDFVSRMESHLKNSKKNHLNTLNVIYSNKFNKSATLDIESNLIKYFIGDGRYRLLNGNMGLADHTYFQKDILYGQIFKEIWDLFRKKGISKSTIEEINNTDLFKYSPYKSLSRDQRNSIVEIVDSLVNLHSKTILVEGGAGTGKTVLAIYIIKMIISEPEDFNFKEFEREDSSLIEMVKEIRRRNSKPRIALVIPMQSFRTTIKKLFKHIKGLTPEMVIGPAELAKSNEKYDLVIVDEGHRLRQRKNLSSYFSAFDKVNLKLNLEKYTGNELDWIKIKSKQHIIFYDSGQTIKPSDIDQSQFDILRNTKGTKCLKLNTQFRVNAGNDYVLFLEELLAQSLPNKIHRFKNYELKIFNSIKVFQNAIIKKEEEHGLCRMIAGFSWKWESKNNKNIFDIDIDGHKLQWNATGIDWINTPNSINEVGCIHTSQGYDLNYAGIILGNEIIYDPIKKKICINKEQYFDKNGKNTIADIEILKKYIFNIYRTMMLRGIKGTYLYICDPELRAYFSNFIETE
jgi:DUF2075 family protein/predicted GIY-YIG superfamily endonuclease